MVKTTVTITKITHSVHDRSKVDEFICRLSVPPTSAVREALTLAMEYGFEQGFEAATKGPQA